MKNLKKLFFMAGMITIIIVLSFVSGLNINSFKNNHINSLSKSYNVVAGEKVKKIEYGLKYGKHLESFYDIEHILIDIKNSSTDVDNVRIVLKNGNVGYDLNHESQGQVVEEKINNKLKSQDFKDKEYEFILEEDKYHMFIPIKNINETIVGYLEIIFEASVIEEVMDKYIYSTIKYTAIIMLIAIIVLGVFINRCSFESKENRIENKKFIIIILLILGLTQIANTLNNINTYRQGYVSISRSSANICSNLIKENINSVLSRGMSYKELYGIEIWLDEILKSNSEIESISIVDSEEGILYRVGTDNNFESTYELALDKDKFNMEGKLKVGLSSAYINDKITNMILDAITILVISFVFMIEIVICSLFFVNKKVKSLKQKIDVKISRPIAFLFFLAVSLTTSFIPVMMKKFLQGYDGKYESVIYALPVSVEVFASIVSIIITGRILDRRGWRFPFIVGLGIVAIGSLISAFASNVVIFVLTRGIVGIGYGFSWMALRGFVSTAKDENERSEGFAYLNAGIYAGINCSVVLGAILSEVVGYSNVFVITFIIIIITFIFTLIFTKNENNTKDDLLVNEKTKDNKNGIGILFKSKLVVSFFILIAIPTSIGLMFLNYFIPIYAKEMSISSSNVGRAFLIYGLCLVYLGPVLGKQIGVSISVKKANILSSFLCGGALIVFSLGNSFLAAIFAVLILGISDSIGIIAQNNYFLNMKEVNIQGKGTSLGIYSIIKKFGQMIGPMIFGMVIPMGIAKGVGLIGITFILFVVVFLWVENNQKIKE